MSGEAEEDLIRECIRTVRNVFTTYDQAVDIISSLEAFFEEGYHDAVECFDRFPKFKDPDLTPDGTVLFKNGYGLVIEIKRTLPDNDDGFLRAVHQVKGYDTDMDFKASDGGTRRPRTMDIVLLIKSDNANEIFKRFMNVCEVEGIEFDHNLVFMDYYYDSSDTVSKYVIRKWIGENREFLDDLGENGLEEMLGKRAKSLTVVPEQFIERKLASVFINDDPPEIYTAVFLWTKVLYNLLSREQQEEWRVAGPIKRLFIESEVDTIVSFINDELLVDGRVRRRWIVHALQYLETCKLVEFPSRDRVKITYHNLRQMISPRRFETNGQRRVDESREYCGLFADLYCRKMHESDDEERTPDPTVETGRQESIFDFTSGEE